MTVDHSSRDHYPTTTCACLVFFVAGTIAVISGCATRVSFAPVKNSSQRIDARGFSVVPPPGTHWYRMLGGENAEIFVLFHKLHENKDEQRAKAHTFAAMANLVEMGRKTISSAEELAKELVYMDRQWVAPGARMKLLDANYGVDNTLGPTCVRGDVVHEDHGVPGWSGAVFIVESHGFHCVHPGSPTHMVQISYSERRLKNDKPWGLEREGEAFVRSLIFLSMPAR